MKNEPTGQEEFLPINGRRQYLLHYPCQNKAAPVVLLISSPGRAESAYSYAFQQSLSRFCTLVCWDPLGTGKTLTENQDTFPTMDQLLKDMFVVVSCLKIKYWKDRIVLLAHAYGNIPASLYSIRHPGDVLCCIGAAPVTDTQENEKEAFRLLQERISAVGNQRDLARLKHLAPYPERDPRSFKKKLDRMRSLQRKYKTSMGRSEMAKIMYHSPLFNWSDFSSAAQGQKGNAPLWEFLTDYTLEQEHRSYKVPVYYILGQKDELAPAAMAQKYLNRLAAPEKKAYVLPEAGHCMMLRNQDAFASTVEVILSNLSSV